METDALPWLSNTAGGFLLLGAVAAVAFFAASEAALLSANRVRLRHRAERGEASAHSALRVVGQHDRLFATILATENLCIIAATSLGTALAIRLFGSSGVAYATAVLGFVVIVFGEITPKTLAAAHADRVAPAVAPVIEWIMRVLRPVVWILGGIARIASRATGAAEAGHGSALSGEELRTMVGLSRAGGGISQVEAEMLGRILELRRVTARDIMTPRTDIAAVSARAPMAKVLAAARAHPHTRLLVYGRDFDDLLGWIAVRDLVGLCSHTRAPSLRELVHPLPRVPASLRGAELVRAFRDAHSAIAAVLDEYGGVAGVVTFTDVMEQVMGDILEDRHDEPEIVREGDSFRIHGRTPLREVNEALSIALPEGRWSSLAGFLMHRAGRIPEAGEEITAEGVTFVIEEMEGRRIGSVRARSARAGGAPRTKGADGA